MEHEYIGYVSQGQPHGLGVLRTKKCYFCGDFMHGIEHGHGILELGGPAAKTSQKSEYKGQFKNG